MSFQNFIKAAGILMLVMAAQISFGQNNRSVTGTVMDSKGVGLRGVSVTPKGGTGGTTTDAAGTFYITVGSNITVLVFSSVGYMPQEVSIAGTSNVSVVLVLADNSLGEVVVTGYGTTRKSDLTAAITSISARDFNQGPIASPEQLINGKLAGVQITAAGGAPGSGGRIRVRGTSSLAASSDPLVIIDGIPIDQQSGIAGSVNPLNLINPNDIENFTILKDASAAAIYGNRATNGVIIITTKKGKAGKFRLNFSTNNSVATVTETVDVLSAEEFRTVVNNKGNSNQKALLGNQSTDWQDQIYRNAFTTDNNISMSGGIDKLPYRLSLGYLNQNGILKTGNMSRFSTALNLNPRLLNNSLRVDFNVKASFTNNFFANEGAIGGAAYFDPTQPTMRNDNRFGGYFEWLNNNQPDGLAPRNPLGMLYLREDESNVSRYITSLNLDYTFPFLKDLRANLNLGYDYANGEGTVVIPDSVGMDYIRGGRNNQYDNKKKNKLLEFYFNYVKDLSSIKSRLDVMAGYGYQDFRRMSTNFADYRYNKTVFAPAAPFPFETQNTLISFFGRANFSINNKYLITAGLRRDGSSRFAPDVRWGMFPFASVAWNIAEEDFIKNGNIFSALKIRVGYGETGQQEIGNDYQYIPNYQLGTQTAQYQFGSSFYQVNRPVGFDANLKWEETSTTNIGLDFGFFKGRLFGSVDYYNKETEDLINRIQLPAGTNFTNELFTNVGSMVNKGIEVQLNGTILKKTKLTWDAGVNFTYNKNEVTNLTKFEDPNYIGAPTGGISGAVGNTIQIHTVGYRPNSFFVLQQVYNQDGMPVEGLYVDQNKDGIINNLDYYRYQSPEPLYLVGFHTNLAYDRWNFGTVLRANIGNYMYNNTFSNGGVFGNSSVGFLNNVHRNYLETGFGTWQYFSDYYVENASFLRMDNFTVSYNFGSVFNKKANLRAIANVQNVFVITKYRGLDPEIAGGIDNNFYPRPRVYSLGFNLDL